MEDKTMKKMISTVTTKLKKATFVFLAAGIMVTSAPAFAAQAPATTAAATTATASATPGKSEQKETFMECEVTNGTYQINGVTIPFKYSDGFFKVAPEKYQPHMATTSLNLAHASDTNPEKVNGQEDYTNAPNRLINMLKQMGFSQVEANEAYRKKPTADSIGFVVGSKYVMGRYIVSITIRSAGYEKEWASNVTLGASGEAEGFSKAANEVFDYVMEHYLIKSQVYKYMRKGKVDFWVQGYSRGGAVANLTSKRLADKCSGSENRVYAYCIEAPQGGVASEEKKGVSYAGIHNVINPADLVPYVAPTDMGFKRYGVDHYVTNDTADEKKLVQSKYFANNMADNDDTAVSAERLELVKKRVKDILKDNSSKTDEYMPYTVTNKKLNLRGFSLDNDPDNKRTTPEFIRDFVSCLIKSKKGETLISRNDYVKVDWGSNCSLQKAFRNMVTFIFNGGKIDQIKDKLNWKDYLSAALHLPMKELEGSVTVYSKDGNDIKNAFNLVFNSGDFHYELNLNKDARNLLVQSALDMLRDKAEIIAIFASYPGGEQSAFAEMQYSLPYILKGVQSTDLYATFVANVSGIFHNHSMIQTLAWLQSYDSWFEASAK